jgi:hypothetical protein
MREVGKPARGAAAESQFSAEHAWRRLSILRKKDWERQLALDLACAAKVGIQSFFLKNECFPKSCRQKNAVFF